MKHFFIVLLYLSFLIYIIDSFHLNNNKLSILSSTSSISSISSISSSSKLTSLKMELQLKYLKLPIQDDTSKYEILLKV